MTPAGDDAAMPYAREPDADAGPEADRGADEQERRRGAPRRKQLKDAQIVYRNGNSVLDCTVQDLSETGARLRTDTMIDLPDEFELRFRDGRKRRVEMVWRKSNRVGVRFVDIAGGGRMGLGHDPKAALVERIARIERELAELRSDLMIHFRD